MGKVQTVEILFKSGAVKRFQVEKFYMAVAGGKVLGVEWTMAASSLTRIAFIDVDEIAAVTQQDVQ